MCHLNRSHIQHDLNVSGEPTLTHDEVVNPTGACTCADVVSNTLGLRNEAQVRLYEAVLWGSTELVLLRDFLQSCQYGVCWIAG
jgi:hypothetical protein